MRSLLLLLLCTYVCAQNLAVNPSFESKTSGWTATGQGYSVASAVVQSGKFSARCLSIKKTDVRGASQVITVNSKVPSTVTVSAFSIALLVNGPGLYAIQLDIEQMDGKKITGLQAKWNDKTDLWTQRSVTYLADSVRRITVSLIFSGKSGSVWFDNVQATVVKYVPPTTTAPSDPNHASKPAPVPTPTPDCYDTYTQYDYAPCYPASSSSSSSSGSTGSTPTSAPSTSGSTPSPTSGSTPTSAPSTGSTPVPSTGSTPTSVPSTGSTPAPSATGTVAPTSAPSTGSTPAPSTGTVAPTSAPSTGSTPAPATTGTVTPTGAPTAAPVTPAPTVAPTPAPAPTPVPLPATISIGFKYLILSATSDDIRLLVARQTFDSVGSQYDVIIPSTFGNGSFPLTNGNGIANYYGVVFCTDVYGATVAQTAQLNDYMITYKIKSVLLYSYPYLPNGVTVSPTKAATADYSELTFTAASASYISGYNKTTRIPSDQVYSYPAIVTNSSMATPALMFNFPGDATTYVAGAFIKQVDGRQQLQFYLDMATWAPHAVALGPFWLQWLSNNFYLGLRRIYLNCQMDDLFLASDLWDPDHVPVGQHEDGPTYRITSTELYNLAVWQRQLNAKLPATSNITLDFPFNGNGIIEAGGFTKDTLYLMAKQLVNEFSWQSHTYTHPYLDNLTYAEAKAEMTENLLPTTLQLFGSYNHPRYSNKSMVTPSISGLYNKNALQALWDVGIRYVVGDNSRTDLKTPFQYQGFYTTVEKNGFAGMHVMPREATYVYYDCSIPRELESEYNFLYTTYYGGPSTVEDIMAREGKRVTTLFLAFRNDPYMFHQANLREYVDPITKKTTTLLRHWVESVVSHFALYYDLPIHAHTHDLLSQKLLNRAARDNCGFQSTLIVDTATRKITGITGSSTGQCSMAITGVQPATAATKLTVETYGPDTTTWVYMNRDKMSFNFKTPVQM